MAHCTFKASVRFAPSLALCTPATKDYIHNFLFSELISRKITFQLQEIFFCSGMNFPKITYHVFVCDSENYHPPENVRSQEKMFLELISLCKCNFSNFHNYFFMQVQVGVLPELIFKQVVMQAHVSSTLQRGFSGDFGPGKSKSLSRCCLGCVPRSS